jgi:hypothetical protein
VKPHVPAALAATLLLLLPPDVSAQTVLVRVTEAESAAPITGAFVVLMAEGDRIVDRGLTDRAGRHLFSPSGTGPWRIRAEMIGRETRTGNAFTLRPGESSQVLLALPVHAVPLEGIRVEADERCRLRPDEASEVARVWEEARKALTVQSWAEREGLHRLVLSNWERDLDRTARRVEREERRRSEAVGRAAFATLPAAELAERGFVRPVQGGGHDYFAPDANVLLSDPFLDTHCLRLTRSPERPGSIGLAFEPAGGHDVPDVAGTLWLDEATARLSFLEYRYTWAPYPEARGVAGGRVEFDVAPDGAWIVDRWWIRAPILGRDPAMARAGDSGIRVVGIRETGGEVTEVRSAAGATVVKAERGTLRGVVWDSTRAIPLAGARVALSGVGFETATDDRGRFVLDEVPPGVFTAVFDHPRLDSLGVQVTGREVEVVAGHTAEVRLAVPSTASLSLARCRVEEGETGGAVLSGTVRDATTGEPVPGATVRVEWQEVEATEPVVRASDRWFEVRTDEEGRYTACGVPLDEAVRVRASFLGVDGAAAEVGFDAVAHSALDLEIELPPGFLSPGSGQSVAVVGAQGVQGVLVDAGTGRPVPSADVSLRDPSGRILVTGVTNLRGFFRLETPEPGRFLFSSRALGWATLADEAVEVTRDELSVLEIRMVPEALELEPVVVTAERRSFYLEMEGFYERMERGFGVYLPPEELDEQHRYRITDLFFRMPGTRVLEPAWGSGGRVVYFRSGEKLNGICWPMVYLDHHLMSPGGGVPAFLDEYVAAPDVAAIEVYRSPAEIPAQFHGANAGCGVVVLWTHRGRGG